MTFLYCIAALAATQTAHLTSHSLASPESLEPLVTTSHETLRALSPLSRDPRRHRAWDRPSMASALLRPAAGGIYVRDRGQDLIDALAQLPEERRALGPAAFTVEALLQGSPIQDPLCEDPTADFDLVHQQEPFEARYRADPYIWFTEPTPSLYALSSSCTDSLLAAGSTIADAIGSGCSPEDEAAHFPPMSRCRSCLELDGDHARCVGEAACRPMMSREMAVTIGGSTRYVDVMESTVLACAPDFTANVVLLAYELGEESQAPPPFDHAALSHLCFWFWNQAADEARLSCYTHQGTVHLAVGDVVAGRVDHIRRPGDTSRPYRDRLFAVSEIEIEGMVFNALALLPTHLAEVSNRGPGSFGFAPDEMRPDGTPFARDWLGGIVLKTATRFNGVPIVIYNRNICQDAGDWKGPDARGRYFCRTSFENLLDPMQDPGWALDWGAYLIQPSPEITVTFPLVTLASTGEIDPRIPGGHVPQMFGSPVLADPEWENCAWPEMFEPDEMANLEVTTPGTYTFTSQTYRFGKDPNVDIRVVLATNWRRSFCFEAIDDL